MAIHILPINDLKEHEESSTCECNPKLMVENGEMIFVHNSFDGREEIEEGGMQDITTHSLTHNVVKDVYFNWAEQNDELKILVFKLDREIWSAVASEIASHSWGRQESAKLILEYIEKLKNGTK